MKTLRSLAARAAGALRGAADGLRGWARSSAIFALTAVLAVVLKPALNGEVSSGLIFVLGITLVGATSGLAEALLAAVLASAIFNFFLADPVLTFRLSSGEDLAPPLIFTACAIVSGVLAGRLKERTRKLEVINLQLESLLEASRALQGAHDLPAVQTALAAAIPAKFGSHLALFEVTDGEVEASAAVKLDDEQMAVARLCLTTGNVVRGEGTTALPLRGSGSSVGVLVIEYPDPAAFDRPFLEALAGLVGLAVERAQLASLIAESQALTRTDELKSALLGSVSHDLRTPLATISASASSLIAYRDQLDTDTTNELLKSIVDECDRLNRLTANLLELSRLQSGSEAIRCQVVSAGDVTRMVVQRMRGRARGHTIELKQSGGDLLVYVDTALFDLALTNVVENALTYSPADSTVLVQVESDSGECVLTVTDEGCGIPASEQDLVFDRFYRGNNNQSAVPGSGLGLAIAKGFVEAFGGAIRIVSPSVGDRGTTVSITLPLVPQDSRAEVVEHAG